MGTKIKPEIYTTLPRTISRVQAEVSKSLRGSHLGQRANTLCPPRESKKQTNHSKKSPQFTPVATARARAHPQVILTGNTPAIVVLEYEDLNLVGGSESLTAQAICVSSEKEHHQPTTTANTVLTLPKHQPSEQPPNSRSSNSNSPEAAAAAAAAAVAAATSTVNIIRCIASGDNDEVPTIHIVDTVENEAVVKKIEGALHSFNPADIKSIEELVNKSGSAANKEERISLSFLNTATVLQQPKKSVDKSNGESLVFSCFVVSRVFLYTYKLPIHAIVYDYICNWCIGCPLTAKLLNV